MAIHLVKLCVGIDSFETLEARIKFRMQQARELGAKLETCHTTRMVPTRREQLLDGGSLYWVIKGKIQARQRLLDIRPFKDETGTKRCDLVLGAELIATKHQPKRAFQGWRYLADSEVPADILNTGLDDSIPENMRLELSELCLI